MCSRREFFPESGKKKRRPTRGRWRDDDDDKKETFAFSRNSRKGKESSRTNGVGLVGSRSRARRRRREEGVGLIPLFFLKRESAFEEWLTPQKRELFFEDFFPLFLSLFLFLAKRVVASTIERKARESSEGGFRMNDVVRIVSRVLDDDDDDDDGALVHEMDNG